MAAIITGFLCEVKNERYVFRTRPPVRLSVSLSATNCRSYTVCRIFVKFYIIVTLKRHRASAIFRENRRCGVHTFYLNA